MRAIIHLRFFCSKRLFQWRASSESVSGWHGRINGLRRPATSQHAGNPLPKFLPTRINRLQASQNAAALLFDLGTVDIR
jgi:hypothetical protein